MSKASLLVTPQEALKSRAQGPVVPFKLILPFVKEMGDIYSMEPEEGTRDGVYDLMMTVFNAGVIHGVRQERIMEDFKFEEVLA
jgi:hypothetical protein